MSEPVKDQGTEAPKNGSSDEEWTSVTPSTAEETKATKDKKSGADKIKAEEVGTICEFKSLNEYPSKNGKPEIIERDTKRDSTDSYARYAFVERRTYDIEAKKIEKTKLSVNSEHILKALKQVITYYPGLSFGFEPGYSFDHPYMPLHHHFDEIKEYVNALEDPSEHAKSHLQLLVDFLDKDGEEFRKEHAAGVSSFNNLWALYKPGCLLYSVENDYPRIYSTTGVGYVDFGQEKGKALQLSMEYTMCDGEHAGNAINRYRIADKKEFLGESAQPITNMSIYPLSRLGPDREEALKKKLIERGEEYLNIKGIRCFRYKGSFMYLKTPPIDYFDSCGDFAGVWLPATTNGRVVVDAKTFKEEMRRNADSLINRMLRSQKKTSDSPDYRTQLDIAPLLCPPFVYGFCLETKQWAKFFLDNLQDPEWVPNAMEKLVLPDHRKRAVRSLVSAHSQSTVPGVDEDPRNESGSKGAGLVFLLHGVPGSGKTLTAELVAEHTQRPLMNISTGELGSYERQVSTELKRLLTYAAIWHAIVLIDEADVFLEARKSGTGYDTQALEQNALVAVFLRQLEYFRGIIFLTSNRVGVFDHAVRSRIHLALHYDAPTSSVRRELWFNKVQSVAEKADVGSVDMKKLLDRVEDFTMNGREISNAVNTACTLARDEQVALTEEHVLAIVELWKEFEGSVGSLTAPAPAQQ